MGDSDEEFDRRRRDKFRSERREYRDDRGGGGGGRGGGGGGGWEDRYATLSHVYKVQIFVIASTLESFSSKWQGCTNNIRSETMNCFAQSAKFRSMSHKQGNCQPQIMAGQLQTYLTFFVFKNFVEADRTGEEEVVVEAEIDMEAEKITIGEERELIVHRETT